jgi:hypothetical protein
MRARSIQGLALAAAAVALLAGCSGGGGDAAAPAAGGAAAAPVKASTPAPRPAVRPEPAPRPAPRPEPAQSTPPQRTTPAPRPEPARPVIGAVTTTPRLACDGVWCTVPAGPGTVTFHVEVTGAYRVELFLVPTGTDTWALRRSLGVDRDGRDGWSVTWAYGSESLMHHLVVEARGPGGTVQESPVSLVRE